MNTPERESGENVQDDAIHPETQQPCKDYFGKYGICPKGDSCPFTHGEDASTSCFLAKYCLFLNKCFSCCSVGR